MNEYLKIKRSKYFFSETSSSKEKSTFEGLRIILVNECTFEICFLIILNNIQAVLLTCCFSLDL